MSDKKVWMCECKIDFCAGVKPFTGCRKQPTAGYFIPATRRRLERKVLRSADEDERGHATTFYDDVRALRAYDEKEKWKK